MLDFNLAQLTHDETQELDNSFDSTGLSARFRYALLGGAIAALVALTLYLGGVSEFVLFVALVMFSGISSIEKVAYVRAQGHSHSLVCKLVRRIEQLEGVATTPDNARPSLRITAPIAGE
jgi:hypothetical protein